MKKEIIQSIKRGDHQKAFQLLRAEVELDLQKHEKGSINYKDIKKNYNQIYKEITKIDAPSWVWDLMIELVDIPDSDKKINQNAIRDIIESSLNK